MGQLSEFGDGSGIEVAVSVAGVQGSQRDQTDTSGPANTILLRKNKFCVWDKGHTEACDVEGPIGRLSGRLLHDDWKPTSNG